MMVTFVSQCEKKSLAKTRRVLDAFANRIGSNTWQTVITNEGLQAVKTLLRSTASKNTAVSCHWLRSRSRSELVWIVGNRSKFNAQGIVPVNTTQKTIMNTQWENDWGYLPLIKCLSALAALFHDWGKASELFQEKLQPDSPNKYKGDPIRHEWISTLFLNAFVGGENDERWLQRLIAGEFDLQALKEIANKKTKTPMAKLPNAASLLAWLIVSHHRLPAEKIYQGMALNNFQDIFGVINQTWGYENKFDEDEFKANVSRCFDYPKGLPSQSDKWLRYTKRNAQKLLEHLPLLEKTLQDGSWRLILHHARLSLMLGDHYYSSQDADTRWHSDLDLYANTDRKTKRLKQQLDEHLVGVAKQAVRTAHLLPAFEGKQEELPRAFDIKVLKQKSPAKFAWQDKAVSKIAAWRAEQDKLDDSHFGFFAVNMASTGQGKTFANAKVMRALSQDKESLRFILALGLRTLTLQTGDEYRDRIGLKTDELAVLIGSRAVLDLHNKNKQREKEKEEATTGSESEETLLDNEIYFESEIPESDLSTVLTDQKSRQFLFAPVLSCTIDHLMAATETRRGGRYILPALRLMSSDLVIDEIDDFDGTDLIAIGRLIHLAGILGRKVMISSATIPPDIAEGYFNAYQAGWSIFATMRGRKLSVGCAWVDEFTTHVHTVHCAAENQPIEHYRECHQSFVAKRLKALQQQQPKRKANIVDCDMSDSNDEEGIRNQYYDVIQGAIIKKHHDHHGVDRVSGKSVSFGVVRVANIKPCIELTRYLLNCDWPDDVEVRIMAYHSQQILIMRNEQEKHLDAVLKRNSDEQAMYNQVEIRAHLDSVTTKHVMFILVATPVEEVGRDHDFDWAVVEPSSYRSFIQLAGRVLRHRDVENGIKSPNMALLQYNLRALLNSDDKTKPVFCWPGYESSANLLNSHDLSQLVDAEGLAERLDAQPRISKILPLCPKTSLVDLEHETIHQLLTSYNQQGPESIQGWLTGCWWLTAVPQLYVRFRNSSPQLTMYLMPKGEYWKFSEKNDVGKPIDRETTYGISKDESLTEREHERLWLHRDYESLLQATECEGLWRAASVYGEIGLPTYGKDANDLSFTYSSQFGLIRSKAAE